MIDDYNWQLEEEEFPSPLGEVGSLMLSMKTVRRVLLVSVPSRGSGFLNVMNRGLFGAFDYVSVPSRGSGFLNVSFATNDRLSVTRFPSPLGEVGSLMKDIPWEQVEKDCFRPLSGKWVP